MRFGAEFRLIGLKLTLMERFVLAGAVSRTKTTSASGAGMLSLRDRSQNVIVTFGKFIEEGTLDRSHFCIQMHKTHAEWGVGDSMQRCDAVDIE